MYVEFVVHRERNGWWAEWPGRRYCATADSEDALMQMCREGVEFVTGRPAAEHTIVWRRA